MIFVLFFNIFACVKLTLKLEPFGNTWNVLNLTQIF